VYTQTNKGYVLTYIAYVHRVLRKPCW